MFADLQESLRLSIERCIREHLEQDVDSNNAIVEASHEIVRMISRPILPETKPCGS